MELFFTLDANGPGGVDCLVLGGLWTRDSAWSCTRRSETAKVACGVNGLPPWNRVLLVRSAGEDLKRRAGDLGYLGLRSAGGAGDVRMRGPI